jgi:hypothetical protein
MKSTKKILMRIWTIQRNRILKSVGRQKIEIATMRDKEGGVVVKLLKDIKDKEEGVTIELLTIKDEEMEDVAEFLKGIKNWG